MIESYRSKITFVWLILIIATAISWQFGHGMGFGESHHYGTLAVLVVTFVKVGFVYIYFMELETAPPLLRLLFHTWAALICTILIALYWNGI